MEAQSNSGLDLRQDKGFGAVYQATLFLSSIFLEDQSVEVSKSRGFPTRQNLLPRLFFLFGFGQSCFKKVVNPFFRQLGYNERGKDNAEDDPYTDPLTCMEFFRHGKQVTT